MPAPVVAEIPTDAEASIGHIDGVGDKLLVGESFQQTYRWEDFDDDTLVADFTGYVPTANAIDAAGTLVGTAFTVTPSPGDALGEFTVVIDNTQTTAAMRDNAVAWVLSITLGTVTKFLICAPFNVEDCVP